MNDELDDLDPPVAALVAALNALPGIVTLDSCGGHEEQEFFNQAPAGHYYVSFLAEQHDPRSWESLHRVAALLPGDVKRLDLYIVEAYKGEILFTLNGGPDPSADELAVALR